ncbi:MAG TPA: hypothetical protein VK548_25635 [Candidatus Acidoferrum sp.]|nr:hypothetical protein [Candidatus Acidoferrum sp.]
MSAPNPNDVTLHTLHEDLTAGFAELHTLHGDLTTGFAEVKAEMRAGFADVRSGVTDLKTTLIAGFRGLASRESVEEIVRLLREANRLSEARFSQLDVRTREQSLEIQQVLHALAEGQRRLDESHRRLTEEQRSLSAHIRALIEAMLGRRSDGPPPA